MSFVSIADEVRDQFRISFTTAHPSVIVLWDNQKKPAVLPKPTEIWVKFSIRERRSRLASLGNPGGRLIDRSGVAVAELYVPVGDGEKRLREMADWVAEAIELQATMNVQLRETRMVVVGNEGSHYKAVALTEFIGGDFI